MSWCCFKSDRTSTCPQSPSVIGLSERTDEGFAVELCVDTDESFKQRVDAVDVGFDATAADVGRGLDAAEVIAGVGELLAVDLCLHAGAG